MLRAAAEGLQGANLTVLNGADGLNGTVASLAGQGMAILKAITQSLPGEQEPLNVEYDEEPVEEEEQSA